MAQEPARMAVFRKLQMPAQCGSVPERPPMSVARVGPQSYLSESIRDVFLKLIIHSPAKDSEKNTVLLGKGQCPDNNPMINGILGQTPAMAPGAANSGYPYGDGIRFEDEVWTPEEQELEVIKRKILEKLMVRLGAGTGYSAGDTEHR
jgi:hypothetical protein